MSKWRTFSNGLENVEQEYLREQIDSPLHQELANLVNASRAMVTNVLNDLKHEGVIGVNQRMFYLVDSKLKNRVIS